MPSFRHKLDILDLFCPLPPPEIYLSHYSNVQLVFRRRASDGSLATSHTKKDKKRKSCLSKYSLNRS